MAVLVRLATYPARFKLSPVSANDNYAAREINDAFEASMRPLLEAVDLRLGGAAPRFNNRSCSVTFPRHARELLRQRTDPLLGVRQEGVPLLR